VRTAITGQLVTVHFNASATGPQRALVGTGSRQRFIAHGAAPLAIENVRILLREKKMGSLGHGMALLVTTGRWDVQAYSKHYPNAAANPGKALLNVAMSPKYDIDHDVVAPHGLIGQSYDGDNIAVDGNTDDYSAREVTTQAMAEGAIEGKAVDYQMPGPFDTDYKYTRFDATSAKPRDVSQLTGKKTTITKKGPGTVSAFPDVE